MALPLEGYKVADFAVAIYGALTTMMLGDLGADVIKIEPLEGDFMRLTDLREGDSARWMMINRSKRSLAVDLKNEKGAEIVRKIVKSADALVQNYRPGVMERMGFGYEDVAKLNPKIVYCSMSGFGQTGPFAHRIGGDMWTQAFTGAVASQGDPDGPPYIGGVAWADHGGACVAAFGIVSALLQREREGIGQEITTSLVESGIHIQAATIGDYLIDGRVIKKGGRGWAGGFTYGAYPCKDGDIVTIMGASDDDWPIFCKILGIEHLLNDPRYKTAKERTERRFELYPHLDQAFLKKTRAEWQEEFRKNRLRADPALDYKELFDHPQMQAIEMITEVEHSKEGKIKMIGQPVKFKKAPRQAPYLPPPVLGEHTEEILHELGYTKAQIKELTEEAVVGVAEQRPKGPAPRPGTRRRNSPTR